MLAGVMRYEPCKEHRPDARPTQQGQVGGWYQVGPNLFLDTGRPLEQPTTAPDRTRPVHSASLWIR